MNITQITNHVVQALARRMQQYKEKKRFASLITALTNQIQDIEDVGFSLFTLRQLDFATGIQLDRFGEIVDQAREGFDDDFYRILLKAKIGINNSSGEPTSITNTAKLLTQASVVHYMNHGGGGVGIAVDVELDPDLVDFIFTNMQKVVMAGVRVDFIATFDPDESFSFDGTGPIGLGFSSLAAPTTGGKFAFLNRRTTPVFAFNTVAGAADPGADGFGALGDPLAGGLLQGL